MYRTLLAVLAAAASAAAITPAAASAAATTPAGNGNTGTWSTLTGGTAPPPYTFEGRLYGGWADANTFGWNVNSGIFGVGGALRVPIGQFRWDTEFLGEESTYRSSIGNPSFLAFGTHLNWMITPTSEIGAFGGFENALPSFNSPGTVNGFIGLEGRQFWGPAMFGIQAGYLDNASGPGTLIRTGFVDGRFKLSLGELSGIPQLRYTILGANLGGGFGTDSATLTQAQSTFWGASLSQGILNTPFSVTFDYQHFNNHVDGTGTVWREDLFLGGFKVLLPPTDVVLGWKEPTLPLPSSLFRAGLFF